MNEELDEEGWGDAVYSLLELLRDPIEWHEYDGIFY